MIIKLTEGMKLKVIQGDQDYDGKGKHSPNVNWIAGAIPVGAIGTVYKATLPNGGSMWALNFEGITPKEGYIFGLGSEDYNAVSFEEIK